MVSKHDVARSLCCRASGSLVCRSLFRCVVMEASEPTSACTTSIHGWRLFFGGVCMGVADLIPGISGGTMAFILGFYQPLLDSLKTFNLQAFIALLKGNKGAYRQQIQWKFLLTLVSGICFSIVCFSNLFHSILSNEFYRIYLYAIFLGLILASFFFCLKQVHVWSYKTIGGLCMGTIGAYLLTESTLSPSRAGEYAVQIEWEMQGQQASNFNSDTHMLYGLSRQDLGVLLAQGWIHKSTPVHHPRACNHRHRRGAKHSLPRLFYQWISHNLWISCDLCIAPAGNFGKLYPHFVRCLSPDR